MYRAIFLFPVVAVVPTVTLLATRFSGGERRSHFWLRVVLMCLLLPVTTAVVVTVAVVLPDDGEAGAFVTVLVLLTIAALMALESVLFRASDSSSGGSDDSGGRGPGQPPSAPDRPGGKLPLAASEVGRWRVRDHDRPDLGNTPSRRPAQEPRRQPAL